MPKLALRAQIPPRAGLFFRFAKISINKKRFNERLKGIPVWATAPKVVDNDSPLWYGRYVSLTLDQTGYFVFVATFRQDVLAETDWDTLFGDARCAHEPAQEKGACVHRF